MSVTEERKHLRKKEDPLSFEKWILHNGQPDRNDDRIISNFSEIMLKIKIILYFFRVYTFIYCHLLVTFC